VDKPKVVLGVSGGIAAYKACELLRRLTESGHDVRVVPTASALHFVGAAAWSALSGKPVSTEVWDDVHEVPHVRIGQHADLVVVAPATADMLAKAAHGLADDLLTNTLLTARCPVVFAPAMHTEMWEHPATQENVATLRRRGAVVIEPAVGRLTGVDTGKGRLPDPAEIFEVCRRVLARGVTEPDLGGRHVVVSAGGTREPLDPVRFLGNRSSGKQGYALARTAAARGARVTLVAANTALPDPAGVDVVPVGTAVQLREAVLKAAADADAVVMAAAVADFRPGTYATGKIKKKDGQDPDRARTEPGHPRGGLRRPRPPRPGGRRFRRRDGRRAGQRPGEAPAQGLRPARGERGGGEQDIRLRGERGPDPGRRRQRHTGPARAEGSLGRNRVGSGRRASELRFFSPQGSLRSRTSGVAALAKHTRDWAECPCRRSAGPRDETGGPLA